MIKPVEANEVPHIIHRVETRNDIEHFLNSEMNCCEIVVNDSTPEKVRQRYYCVARRMKLNIKFSVRGNRVFMIKKEDN